MLLAFSFIIEFLQLLFHLGTFQISDLCYNTLGGTIGGVIYFVSYKLKNEKN
ncbi:VanZ family protein [Ruminococcus sp. AF42-9BH]|nr:VanZ family protein [Ruminococcus sp. AF42-9BH]